MNTSTLKTLEYDKIINILADYCQSSLGKERARKLQPSSDLKEVESLLEDTGSAIELLSKFSNPPLFGIYDLKPLMKRLNKGGILDYVDYMNIADSLRVSQALKDYLHEYEGDNKTAKKIGSLYTNKRIVAEVERIIRSDEEIHDHASRKLLSIRRNIKKKSEEIRNKLNSILQAKEYQNKLQENIVTMRDGRYVVPIKSEAKRSFPGITHDQSGSGQTVYIEPMVVVELNNDIKKLEVEEREEIRRILKELSKLIVQYDLEIISNQESLIELDLVFAKAKYALAIRATRPIVSDDRIIDIKGARHPLLDPETVVPIDIKIGEDYRALIITGPNTGGKTVSLKTVGLMILMSQSGLFVPCKDFSKLSIFDEIYADIGDKQTIELSLSTFSASMLNIVDILDKADKNSLVLFDELGSGTDPVEGAALAMSIIDDLIKRDITTISTTHYSELKLYAMTTDNVQNASVEFDVETLSPTFKLVIGTPGKSNAFEISKKLGLDDRILANASKHISKENRDFEELYKEIEEDRLKTEEKLIEVQKLKDEYQRLNLRLERDYEDKKKRAQQEVEDSKAEAMEILDQARKEAKAILKHAKKNTNRDRSDLDRTYSEITDKYQDVTKKYEQEKKKPKRDNSDLKLKLGDRVKILSMGDTGVVKTLPDSNGDLLVQMGILKFNVNINDIEKTDEVKEREDTGGYKNVLRQKARQNYSQDLDLRGENVMEAIADIEKFFDDALLVGLKQVNLIHGKGTGALRQGVTDYLKKSSYVEDFRLGTMKEGGSGVTVVTLK